MNNQAYNLYQDLKNSKDFSVQKNLVNAFHTYLEELAATLSTSRIKTDFIIRNTFKSFSKNKIDHKNYLRANIMSATSSFKRYTDSIDLNNLTPLQVKILIDYVCDLKNYVKYFDGSQDYSWLLMNTNTHISNYYYSLSSNIFSNGHPKLNAEEISTLHSSTPFFIRQSIEYKLKRILGIEYWTIEGRPDLQTVKKCFKILDEHKSLFDTRNFDFRLIEVIYSWTNTYIHGGYRPLPWKSETAINYLSELFYKGELSQKNSYSLYGGIEISKENMCIFRNKVKESLMNFNEKTNIKWLSSHEMAIVKEDVKK